LDQIYSASFVHVATENEKKMCFLTKSTLSGQQSFFFLWPKWETKLLGIKANEFGRGKQVWVKQLSLHSLLGRDKKQLIYIF
jgi:hypothetical protein